MTELTRPNVHLTAEQGDAYQALIELVVDAIQVLNSPLATLRESQKIAYSLREALKRIEKANHE